MFQPEATTEAIYQALNSPGLPLKQFLLPGGDIFPVAKNYPAFFNENLLSSTRIIKYFASDAHTNVRAFYYHLLMLSYEIRIYLEKLKHLVFLQKFEILFGAESDTTIFNNTQFKKLLGEFLLLLDSEDTPNLQQVVNDYPIIDVVFIHVLRSLMVSLGVIGQFDSKIDTETVFGSLCSLLDMGLSKYDNCWKFQDSDMFCLDQNNGQLYFVYTSDDLDANRQANLITEDTSHEHFIFNPDGPNIHETTSELREYPGMGSTFGMEPLHHSHFTASEVYEDKENYNNYRSGWVNTNNLSPDYLPPCPKTNYDIKEDLMKLELSAEKLLSNSLIRPNDNLVPFKSLLDHSYSKAVSIRVEGTEFKKSSFAKNNPYNTFQYQQPKPSYEPYVPYTPVPVSVPQPYISPTSLFAFEPIYTYVPPTVQKFSYLGDFPKRVDTDLGDYYRDFTNSILLPMIKEPHQSTLRGIKNRMRGVRRQNIAKYVSY